jgi:hypothetical protein
MLAYRILRWLLRLAVRHEQSAAEVAADLRRLLNER